MKRWLGWALASALIVGPAVGGKAGRAYAQDATDAAQQAANDWLALVDQGRYHESYNQASQSFKVAVGREEWTQKVTAAHRAAGNLLSRKLSRATETRNPPQAPPGDYVTVVYQSSFANVKSALETLVLIRDRDGKWRVLNYIIKPAGRPGP